MITCPICNIQLKPESKQWSNCIGDKSWSAEILCPKCNLSLKTQGPSFDSELEAIQAIESKWNSMLELSESELYSDECELIYGENEHGDDGWWCQSCENWFAASFKHTGRNNIIVPNYCQHCGKKVKQ